MRTCRSEHDWMPAAPAKPAMAHAARDTGALCLAALMQITDFANYQHSRGPRVQVLKHNLQAELQATNLGTVLRVRTARQAVHWPAAARAAAATTAGTATAARARCQARPCRPGSARPHPAASLWVHPPPARPLLSVRVWVRCVSTSLFFSPTKKCPHCRAGVPAAQAPTAQRKMQSLTPASMSAGPLSAAIRHGNEALCKQVIPNWSACGCPGASRQNERHLHPCRHETYV